MKPAVVVAVTFLALVAAAHALRVALQVEVIIGGVLVPMWPSIVAVLWLAALATWLAREGRHAE